MPMSANVCEDHGAYYAEKCPSCVYSEYKATSDASKKFFKEHEGRPMEELVDQYDFDVEELYQHFRIRLLEELDPILSKMAQTSRDQFEAAYYAAARR